MRVENLLTLMGLYNVDDTIFNNLKIPDGVERETLINNIIAECAELEILYTGPEMLKIMIGIWSEKELATWDRFWKATQIEYNPLENYDRLETETTSAEGHTANGGSDENIAQVSAYDADTFKNRDKSTINYGGKQDTSGTGERNLRSHGNIGVTTSQQMLEAELDISEKINIYNFITNSFKNRFCLLVY